MLGLASRVWQQASLAAPAVPGAAQAQGGRRRARPRQPGRHRAPGAHQRAGLRAGLRRRARPPPDPVPVPNRAGRPTSPSGTSSRGASSPGTAAGTSSGHDLTGAPPGSSGCPASPARSARSAAAARSTVPDGIDLRAQVATLVPSRATGRGPAVRPDRLGGPAAPPGDRGGPGAGADGCGRADGALRRPRGPGRGGRRLRRGRAVVWPRRSCAMPSYAGCAASLDRAAVSGGVGDGGATREPRRHRAAVPAARPRALPRQPAGRSR